jgi:SAM-dependent methyltransferase
VRRQSGFIYYDERRQRFGIDWQQSLSIVVGELLLQEILQARSYIKGRLLDVGCGTRPYALIYDPLVEMSVGTEVTYSPHGLQNADIICPAERLPFADASFDTVLCTEVLEHTRDPSAVIQEIRWILRPGGYLLLSVPFIYPIHEAPYDHWRFTSYGLRLLCTDAGLEVIYVHPKGGIGATLIVLWANLAVRGVNAVSKLLRQSIPLRDRRTIRWLLSFPQRIYLWLRNSTAVVGIDKAIGDFLTPGYFLVARRP